MTNFSPLLESLRRPREKFIAAARKVTDQHWRTTPCAGGMWSPTEEIAFATMMETLIRGAAAKITRKPHAPFSLSRRLHIPEALMAWRGVRVEIPIPVDTLPLDDRELIVTTKGCHQKSSQNYLVQYK